PPPGPSHLAAVLLGSWPGHRGRLVAPRSSDESSGNPVFAGVCGLSRYDWQSRESSRSTLEHIGRGTILRYMATDCPARRTRLIRGFSAAASRRLRNRSAGSRDLVQSRNSVYFLCRRCTHCTFSSWQSVVGPQVATGGVGDRRCQLLVPVVVATSVVTRRGSACYLCVRGFWLSVAAAVNSGSHLSSRSQAADLPGQD